MCKYAASCEYVNPLREGSQQKKPQCNCLRLSRFWDSKNVVFDFFTKLKLSAKWFIGKKVQMITPYILRTNGRVEDWDINTGAKGSKQTCYRVPLQLKVKKEIQACSKNEKKKELLQSSSPTKSLKKRSEATEGMEHDASPFSSAARIQVA